MSMPVLLALEDLGCIPYFPKSQSPLSISRDNSQNKRKEEGKGE